MAQGNKNSWFRSIPKVDALLETEEIKDLTARYGHALVMDVIREQQDILRAQISSCQTEEEAMARIDGLLAAIVKGAENLHRPKVRKVINGTGTILHTNLGRAPISREQAEKLVDIVTGYSNLEYNLEAGKRGERYSHFEELLCRITGAEAAMVVNNNASAVMLILSTLAKGGSVVVSRGELVEIGGKFRIPDVMEASGARLIEVGTTNKTHLSDYEDAICEDTKALLKVHTSNYRIVGFTETVLSADLKPLSVEKNIPIIEDLGSGSLVDLSKYGLTYEPTVQDTIRAGVDVVCFSGDKLLGGPQAGIIIGKKEYIAAMKKNQLTRALRVDKFTVTALELVLLEYLNEENAMKNVPVLRMISEPLECVADRAERLKTLFEERGVKAALELADCESQIGGGSLPLERIASRALTIRPEVLKVEQLERAMAHMPTPVVARTAEDAIWIDLRTIQEEELEVLAEMFAEVLK